MKEITKTSLMAFTATLLLSACGGSNGDSPTQQSQASQQYRAIDGYISGATAFLDVNGNGILDDGEPSAITDENGLFSLETSDAEMNDCLGFSPVIVDVPVGAIDSDLGPVTEAYQLVFPPSEVNSISDEEIRNVTPLTSILWSQIDAQLSQENELTCEAIKGDIALRETIQNDMEVMAQELASFYNVPVEELFSDFVASGNTALHQSAMDVVDALQASYAATLDARNAYPNAILVKVNYLQGEIQDDGTLSNDWIKHEQVFYENRTIIRKTEISPTDFSDIAVIEDTEIEAVKNDNVDYTIERGYEVLAGVGTCAVNELVYSTGAVQYGVVNNAMWAGNNKAECDAADFTQNLSSRRVEVVVDDGTTRNHNQWFYADAVIPAGLETFVGVEDSLDTIDTSVFETELASYPQDFDTVAVNGADGYSRIFSGNGVEKIWLEGNWYQEKQFNDNGTFDLYCGTNESDAVLTPSLVACPTD